jgi:hypothetical protein
VGFEKVRTRSINAVVIFNQFDKDWTPLSVSKLFPDLSLAITKFIPNFELLVINLASLSQETMDFLDKFGILKASFLAMKNVRNKTFLKIQISGLNEPEIKALLNLLATT